MPTSTAELPRALAALADDTRWLIVQRLGTSPASASALARELPVTRQAIAKHLEVLADSGLVDARTVGRELRYAVVVGRVAEVGDDLRAIAAGWQRRLERIKELAEADDQRAEQPPHP